MENQSNKNPYAMDIIRSSKQVHFKIESAITEMLSGKGITGVQSHVLMCIMDGGDVYSSDVRKRMNVSSATISGLMKKLREKGYITFESCKDDERQKRISVTPKAVEHKADIDRTMNAIENAAFADFTPEELQTLHRLIIKMSDNIDKINKGGI